MSKAFKAIVEKGYQILQSPKGERINEIIETCITQGYDKSKAVCLFSVLVNYNNSPIYDPVEKTLKTPSGEKLPVEIITYKPNGTDEPDKVFVRCAVEFPYETNHQLTAQPVAENA